MNNFIVCMYVYSNEVMEDVHLCMYVFVCVRERERERESSLCAARWSNANVFNVVLGQRRVDR